MTAIQTQLLTFFLKRTSHPAPEENAPSELLGLLKLPIELLLDILSYLPPFTEACLALTCRTLRDRLGTASWRRLRGRCRPPDDWTRVEVFRLLHLLERDAPDKLWLCFSCTCLHPLQRQAPDRRRTQNFRFLQEWQAHDSTIRPGAACSAVPHGQAASYFRTYLLPRLSAHVSAASGRSLFARSVQQFAWWGYVGLPQGGPEDHAWQPGIGRPSYLGLLKIVTRVHKSKAIIMRFYKYRAATPSGVHSRIAIAMCPHHFTFSSGNDMPDLHPELRPGWDPKVLRSDGADQAIQLTAEERLGFIHAVRCAQCATEMHWSPQVGPYQMQKPPFSGQRYIGVVITHTIETRKSHSATRQAHRNIGYYNARQPQALSNANLWARPKNPAVPDDEDSDEFKLRKQLRADVADFFDLQFSWQYGWRNNRNFDMPEVPAIWNYVAGQ